MKIALILVLLPILAFSSVVDLWKNVQYHAYRLVVEISPHPKMRYEEVFRWKDRKFVRVLIPERVDWYRYGNEVWMGREVLKLVPVEVLDLEDVALRELEESSEVFVRSFKYGYVLNFKTDEGDFKVVLDPEGRPLKITRKFSNIEIKMVYEDFMDTLPSAKSVISELKLSDSKLFPEEIGKVISCLDWFYMDFSDGVLVLSGISDGKWVKIEISKKRLNGSRRFGKFYIKAPEDFMRKILHEGFDR